MLDSCLFPSKFKPENIDGEKLTPLTPFSGTGIKVNQHTKMTQLSDKMNEERVQGKHDNS